MPTRLLLGAAAVTVVVGALHAGQQTERVVPVHEEPRHRLVFDSAIARILDVQIPPGDTTLFHTHSDPILYVTMSTSRTRSQNLGGEWSAAAAGAAAGGPDAAPTLLAPTNPPGRMMSTTSYADRPQTHRVNNLGPALFRLIGITNMSQGDESTGPSAGFAVAPEIGNRWFRGYRLVLGADAAEHHHDNPVALVLAAGAATLTQSTSSTAQALRELGAWAFLDAGTRHALRADVPDTHVMEVEIRLPR